jgi:hypothetical protein
LRPRNPPPDPGPDLVDRRTLGDIATGAGFTAADIAFLSGLEKSTISRCWADPDWLDRINGHTLQQLVPTVPGILDYLHTISTSKQLGDLTGTLARHGLTVNRAAMGDLIASGTAAEEHLTVTLRVAGNIITGDAGTAAKALTRFWGRGQDQVLSHLFDPGPAGLLVDTGPLLEGATVIADELRTRNGSFHGLMGFITIAHHIARATGTPLSPGPVYGGKYGAMFARSSTIGLILGTDDHDLVDRYARIVTRSRVAGAVEDWALPTYANDARVSTDFWLPKGVVLRFTADEVISELGDYNGAYAHYLTLVYLPRALAIDPSFGGRRGDLRTALLDKRQRISQKATCDTIDTLVRHL